MTMLEHAGEQVDRASDADSDGIAVRATGLVKRYGELTAVDGIDFEIRRGTCLGVLGPNGAGKTTTIEILEGLKKPDEGEIAVLGRTWDRDARAIQERIGVQLQETEFQEKLTVRELMRMFQSFYARGRDIDEVIETVGLTEKRDAYVKTMSGGQRQRLSIGCALLNEPEILFLDEPTNGLDPQARRHVWQIIESFRAAGGTILITTHYMEEAERLADDLMIVDHGKVIASGSPASIIATLEAENVVQFAMVDHDASVLTEQMLGELDGVRGVRTEGGRFVLSVVQTHAVIAGLFELASSRGFKLDDLRTHRPTLEDVFVSITGKHLRDE